MRVLKVNMIGYWLFFFLYTPPADYDYAAVAIPYGPNESLGLSLLRLGVDGIPDTRNSWVDANGNGLFDDNNRPDYSKITYFNAADWALYLSYAHKSSDDFSYGGNVKLIRRDLADQSAMGIGFDVAVLYSPLPDLYVAPPGAQSFCSGYT